MKLSSGLRRRRSLFLVAILLSAPLRASALDLDADAEAARRRYMRGSQLYSQSKYRSALAAFEEARELKPLPAFDYNIARCLERLERWGEAVVAYRRFLAAAGDDPVRGEVVARVEELEARVARTTRPESRVPPPEPRVSPPEPRVSPPEPPTPQPEPVAHVDSGAVQPEASPASWPRTPLRAAAIGLVPVTVAVVAGGAVALGLVRGSLTDLEDACRFRPCGANDWHGLEQQTIAGYALLGVAGALAVVDVGLWVAASRQRSAAR